MPGVPAFVSGLEGVGSGFSATRKKKSHFKTFRAGLCTRLAKLEAWASADPHPILPFPPQPNRGCLRESEGVWPAGDLGSGWRGVGCKR